MKIIENITQGGDSWHAHRASSRNASEAPIIMGESSFMSRQELLRQKATGYTPEVDAAKQRLFDAGHAAEHAARMLFEDATGEDFFTVVATTDDGYLSASMDGLNMAGDTLFEHKLFNAELAEAVRNNDIPPMYYWQLEQQLLVSGAEKVVFVCSDGTRENWEQMEYRSVPGRAEKLIAAWKQFDEDLANYQHVESAPKPTAAPITDLPALSVQIVGHVSASNLTEWKAVVTHRIESINANLQNDQDFVDADKMVKFLEEGEKKLDLVKAQAQSQAVEIDETFRAIDEIKATMRSKRLELSKLVEKRKTDIRAEILQEGKNALALHVGELNRKLGRVLMPVINADFAGVMKSKKNIDSLRDAVASELSRCKLEANEIAERIQTNLATLEAAKEHAFLFSDVSTLAMKSPEDLGNVIKLRIAEHAADQQRKLDAERERIRKEEQERADKEAAAKVEAERKEQERIAKEAAAKAEQTNTPPPEARSPESENAPALVRTAVSLSAQVAPQSVPVTDATSDPAWKIAGLVSEMSDKEKTLVLHYCERLIAQRQEAA